MLYAKVVFGIPVEGPFDYIVPESLSKKIKIGSRVWVSFRTQRKVGYIVGLARKTKIKNLKNILNIIDESPILDKNMLLLTRQLADYYCCSWGEAIETALPETLRKGRPVSAISNFVSITEAKTDKKDILLLHGLDSRAKWDMYLNNIKDVLNNKKSVIILLPDIDAVSKVFAIIKDRLGLNSGILYRKRPDELGEWLKIKKGEVDIIIGTRSSIFAPAGNLGLLIIDEEQDEVYKQDQVPHYHAREVALMRTDIQKAGLILGSPHPSLETFYLADTHKTKYFSIPRKTASPQIKIINMSDFHNRKLVISRYLQDSIFATLNAKGKSLLFINRKGFATLASCRQCGLVLKCQRCNINLVYHFKENILSCHYCNFKLEPPKICPNCNSDYIRYSGTGTEKIESELARLFPQARIEGIDSSKRFAINDADIFISTSSVIKETDYNFDLVGVLAIDNSLNHIDFRAAEKTSNLLFGLSGLTDKKMVIQTRIPNHYCFRALLNNEIKIFYEEELRQRKQLKLPPFKHLAIVKLRAKDEERVKNASTVLFNRLKRLIRERGTEIASVNPGQPEKLRGNYYWNILIKTKSARRITKFLKKHLKDFSHSGIILTVDVDPL